MSKPIRILVIEDSVDDTELMLLEFEKAGYDPTWERVETPETMRAALEEKEWDIIISDYSMPHFSGPDALKLMQEFGIDLPFIILSGTIGEDVAVNCMKAGAHDYLLKDNMVRLVAAVEREIREAKVRLERRQSQEALRESEHNLIKGQEIAQMGYWKLDPVTKDVEGSNELLKIFELDRDEMTLDAFANVVHPEDREYDLEHIQRGIEKGIPWDIEHRLLLKNGNIKWVRAIGEPDLDENGKVVHIIGIVQNITERKQAEEELKDSEIRYHNLFENSSEFLFTLDLKGNFTDVNKAAETLTGYTKSELLKMNFKDYSPKRDHRNLFRALYNIYKTGKPLHILPIEAIIKDKSIKYFDTSFSLLRKGEQIIGFQGSSKDITKRKQMEQIQKTLYNISDALNTTDKMRDLYNKIREFLGDVIDTTNIYVTLYNQEQDLLSFDYYIDEFIDDEDTIVYRKLGKGLTDYVIRTSKPLLATEKVLEKLVHSGEVEMIGAPSIIWLGVPLKIDNKVIGVIAVQSYDDPNLYTEKDIEILSFVSEEIALAIKHKQARNNFEKAHEELKGLHKNLQKKVAKAVKDLRKKDLIIYQQSRLASLGEMICNIAHHWRQPITAVGVIIQSYEDAFEDGTLDMDYIEKHTDIIMDILTKMSGTIDNFRFFFKPDKVKENFDLKEIILKTLQFLESNFKYNKINMSSDLAEDCIINGFPNEFSQVLLVILDNAKDELIERNIKDRKLTILLKKIEDKCVLKISDNAGGITKEVLPKIFDPYFTTKEEGKGIGVGLYMAKMIIEKNMGGKLTARNIKNGEEFRIEV